MQHKRNGETQEEAPGHKLIVSLCCSGKTTQGPGGWSGLATAVSVALERALPMDPVGHGSVPQSTTERYGILAQLLTHVVLADLLPDKIT